MMKKQINLLLKIIFGVSILSILFYKIGVDNLLDTISKTKPEFMIIVFCLYLVSFIIGAINLKILFDPVYKFKFKTIFKHSTKSWAIGLITPGKIGEYSIAYFIKEYVDIGKSVAIITIDKIITIIVLCLMAITGTFVFFNLNDALKIIAGIIILISILIVSIFSEKIRELIKHYLLRKKAKMFSGFSSTLKDYTISKKKVLLINFWLTFLKWSISTISTYLLIKGMGGQTGFLILFPLTAITTIVALIPISLSGLGTKELTAVFLYNLIGIDAQITLSVHIVLIFFNYIFAFFFLLAYKVK